jgi:hypothetical protein
MPKINIDGTHTSTPRVVVPNDTWNAEIKAVSDIRDVEKYNKDGTEEKVTLDIELDMNDGRKLTVPMYLSTSICKGNNEYQSSKLYTVLEMAQQLEGVKTIASAMAKEANEQVKRTIFVEFLRNVLISKKCRATTKTTNKGEENEYSRIAEIARFI